MNNLQFPAYKIMKDSINSSLNSQLDLMKNVDIVMICVFIVA